MTISFELSMPNNNSWNGKWSGAGKLYAIIKSFTTKKQIAKAQKLLSQGSFYHNFGDGWGASVSLREVTSAEARKIRKDSRGFCGYDWMVENILSHGSASDKKDAE